MLPAVTALGTLLFRHGSKAADNNGYFILSFIFRKTRSNQFRLERHRDIVPMGFKKYVKNSLSKIPFFLRIPSTPTCAQFCTLFSSLPALRPRARRSPARQLGSRRSVGIVWTFKRCTAGDCAARHGRCGRARRVSAARFGARFEARGFNDRCGGRVYIDCRSTRGCSSGAGAGSYFARGIRRYFTRQASRYFFRSASRYFARAGASRRRSITASAAYTRAFHRSRTHRVCQWAAAAPVG